MSRVQEVVDWGLHSPEDLPFCFLQTTPSRSISPPIQGNTKLSRLKTLIFFFDFPGVSGKFGKQSLSSVQQKLSFLSLLAFLYQNENPRLIWVWEDKDNFVIHWIIGFRKPTTAGIGLSFLLNKCLTNHCKFEFKSKQTSKQVCMLPVLLTRSSTWKLITNLHVHTWPL